MHVQSLCGRGEWPTTDCSARSALQLWPASQLSPAQAHPSLCVCLGPTCTLALHSRLQPRVWNSGDHRCKVGQGLPGHALRARSLLTPAIRPSLLSPACSAARLSLPL